jgi:hypothetical protein
MPTTSVARAPADMPSGGSEAIAAARIAAEEDVGEMIAYLLRPRTRYAQAPAIAAMIARCGGSPAMPA